VVLAWQKEHKADLAKVNVNGGAIALGHPLCLGRQLCADPTQRARANGWRYGCSPCANGGGLANATIIERLS